MKFGLTKPTAEQFEKEGVNILGVYKLSDKKKKYFEQWKCQVEETISQIELCFNINIYVFYLDQDNVDYIQEKQANPRKEFVNRHLSIRAAHVSCGKHSKKETVNILVARKEEHDVQYHCFEIMKIQNFVSQF